MRKKRESQRNAPTGLQAIHSLPCTPNKKVHVNGHISIELIITISSSEQVAHCSRAPIRPTHRQVHECFDAVHSTVRVRITNVLPCSCDTKAATCTLVEHQHSWKKLSQKVVIKLSAP